MRGLRPAAVVGGDVVEVSPAYDHAEITAIAAAHVLYDLVTIMAAPGRPDRRLAPGDPACARLVTVHSRTGNGPRTLPP